MDNIKITIDGRKCLTQEGESILNAARANDMFIPAICYLTRCSPTLACRICLVEVDGKRVYSCNAKVKDGMEVITKNEEILEERRAIMEVYDVNHPLQCGVCDQSGECELQNYTLELGVDSQSYAIPDTKRESVNWSSVLHYDPGLCIVCERCVTVCKDMVGDAAITTGPRGGAKLGKEAKESMPKDAYAMWNKLQKSVIIPSNGTDQTNCSDCGECIAVCPVGALVSRDFQYTTNAWDLTRVPAVSAHSSDGFQIYYEVKPTSISDRMEKIYRVTNEWNYTSLDGAARFAYDFENRGVVKDTEAFAKAVEAFKKAETIRFNSIISNEEALMLQRLKEKTGVKLYNSEVRAYQKFLVAYTVASGNSLYTSDNDKIMRESDFVVSVGVHLRNDAPGSKHAFNNIQKMNKGAGLYFHPIGDTLVPTFGKTVTTFTHKVGLEEVALYLVLELFADKEKLPAKTKSYLESFNSIQKKTIKEKVMQEVTETIVDEETGESKEIAKKVSQMLEKEIEITHNRLVELLGKDSEEFSEVFEKMIKKKERFSLMIGEDLYYHEKAENLARLVALIEQTCSFDILIIPPKSNALGVAQICELDDQSSGYTIGYNENGDFRLSALGDGDLDMPAFNQQEGTFTTLGKRIVPTNAALPYEGYELNDLMRELMDVEEETVDWTVHLPADKGYRAIAFDDLTNSYDNDGSDNRGYLLDISSKGVEFSEVDKFDESAALEGDIAYRCNPCRQFNDFTDKAHQISEAFALYASPSRVEQLGDSVEIEIGEKTWELQVIKDDKMEGDIVCIPDFRSREDTYGAFGDSRYRKVTIRKG
ncbi:MAG: NADH-quinone oxidoreductase subunit G [Sulfurovum sp.]|nr:NADH-quinone oxidoreductase subunit G [Sulfurovum sp.]